MTETNIFLLELIPLAVSLLLIMIIVKELRILSKNETIQKPLRTNLLIIQIVVIIWFLIVVLLDSLMVIYKPNPGLVGIILLIFLIFPIVSIFIFSIEV